MNLLPDRTGFTVFLILALVTTASVDAQSNGKEIIEDLSPILDCQTIYVVNVPLASINFDATMHGLLDTIGDVPADKRREWELQSDYAQKKSERIQSAGAIDLNLIGRLGTLIDSERLIAIRCSDNASAERIAGRIDRWGTSFSDCAVKGNLVLLGWDELFLKLPRAETSQLKSLAETLENAGKFPIRMAFTLSPDQKKAIAASTDGATSHLTDFRNVSVGMDFSAKKLNATITCKTELAADWVERNLTASIKAFGLSRAIKRNLPQMSKWLTEFSPQVEKNEVVIEFQGKQFDAMLRALSRPLVQAWKLEKYVRQIKLLQEIGRGFLKYEEEHGHFPPAYSVNEKGEPMHSWRVLILPYINQRNLYNQFRLTEPWDSSHNLRTAANVPVNYIIDDGDVKDSMLRTRFLALVCENSAIRQKKTTISQITDGTVDTISVAVGSPEQAVPWTCPTDLKGDPIEVAETLLKSNPDGFWIASCDSGSHFVPAGTDRRKLAAAIQIDDGQILTLGDAATLAEVFAGPDTPDPMYDPSSLIPRWVTDYLIPVPWISAAGISR